MSRECGDCYFSKMNVGRSGNSWFECGKKHNKRISLDDPACADFMSDDKKTCDDCEYFESGAFWSTRGSCSLRGIKRDQTDRACPSFFES